MDSDEFLRRKRLRKAIFLGKDERPTSSNHWNLTVYYVADYSQRRAWVLGNFFCVEEVSLLYLETYFHLSLVTSKAEYKKVFDEVRALNAREKLDGKTTR